MSDNVEQRFETDIHTYICYVDKSVHVLAPTVHDSQRHY